MIQLIKLINSLEDTTVILILAPWYAAAPLLLAFILSSLRKMLDKQRKARLEQTCCYEIELQLSDEPSVSELKVEEPKLIEASDDAQATLRPMIPVCETNDQDALTLSPIELRAMEAIQRSRATIEAELAEMVEWSDIPG